MSDPTLPVIPELRCDFCGVVGKMRLWSTTPHSLWEHPVRWPVECGAPSGVDGVCGAMRLSSHRAVRRAVANHDPSAARRVPEEHAP